jgi:hypothetical protein
MTRQSDHDDGPRLPPRVITCAGLLAIVVAMVAVIGVGATGAAAAQQNGTNNSTLDPYYGNASEDVGNESWMEGNQNGSDPSAIFTFVGRAGSYVIGGDGTGSGPMLTGMLLLGAMLGLVVGVPVGMVGGAVLAVLALFGVVGVGLAPVWLLPVAMFGVGLLASTTARGMFR